MARRAQGGGELDELSRSLRALRKEARVSQAEAGDVAGIGQRSVSRIEAGLYLPTADELDALLCQYQPDRDEARRVRELLAERLARPAPSRFIVAPGRVAAIQRRTQLLEDNAETIETFQPSMVIGLAQSEAYVRAVFGHPEVSDASDAVAARLERQRAIFESGKDVILVHSEGALLNALGSPQLMVGQLEHLAEMATSIAHVHIGVVPYWRPLPRPVTSGFRLYDRTTLSVSSETGELFPPDDATIRKYGELFDLITDDAEFGEPAAAHFRRIAEQYRHAN